MAADGFSHAANVPGECVGHEPALRAASLDNSLEIEPLLGMPLA